jgi:hypothetical protein
VTQDDGRVNLSLVAKTSPGCRGLFHPCGDWRKVAYADHGRFMVWDHTQIKRGKRVACQSGFPLQGAHRFESS